MSIPSEPFRNSKFAPDIDGAIVEAGGDWNEAIAGYMNGYISEVVSEDPPQLDFYSNPLTIVVSLPAFDFDAQWSAPLRDIVQETLDTNDWIVPDDLEQIAKEFEALAKMVRDFRAKMDMGEGQ